MKHNLKLKYLSVWACQFKKLSTFMLKIAEAPGSAVISAGSGGSMLIQCLQAWCPMPALESSRSSLKVQWLSGKKQVNWKVCRLRKTA